MPRRATVEEFYARCLAHSTTLDAAARAFAAHGESMDALACAWGADLAPALVGAAGAHLAAGAANDWREWIITVPAPEEPR